MSHELRTPLNAISGYTDLLEAGLHGPVNERQLESLRRIQRNQRHLLSLIEDLLGFARIEAGKLEVRAGAVSIIEMLDAVESTMQPEMERRQLFFERHPCPENAAVLADREKLRQVLLNLVSNAVKYTDPGGHVDLGCDCDDTAATIWVRDSGIGIPPDQMQHIFDPFFQVDRGSTRRYAGVGLGLSIAHDLTRAMGGELTLTSAPGTGTTATVKLPLALGSPTASATR
jgi:signal transduction histidine kinase